MKVLSIGTDKKIFDENSNVRLRSSSYAEKASQYHIVVFTLKKDALDEVHQGNLHIYPTNSLSKLHYYFDAVAVAKKVARENSLESKDTVITTQDPFETGLVGKKLKSIYSFPLQVQVHTDFLSQHFRHSLLNKLRVKISKSVLPSADGIRVVSSFIRDSILTNIHGVKANISVLPIYVDIEGIIKSVAKDDIRADFPEFKFTMVMASRLSPEKRIDLALHSVKKVFEKFPHSGLVICGAGREKSKLKSLAKELGIANNVRFAGWREDLISY